MPRSGSSTGLPLSLSCRINKQTCHILIKRSGEEKPLPQFTLKVSQSSCLIRCFYTLGDDFLFHRVAKVDDSSNNFAIVMVILKPAHVGTIDLHGIEGKTVQKVERRIAFTEIVQMKLHSHLFQLVE